MGYNLPGSSVHGILQARILQWVAMPSFRRSSWPRDQIPFSCGSCIAGRFFTSETPGGKIQHAKHCTLKKKKKKNSYFLHCFFSFSLSRISLPGSAMLISLFRDSYKYLFSFSLPNSICNWSFSLQ